MGIQLFDHNLDAYRNVELMFQTSNRAAVIHPTGTGKSYIAFALCETHPDQPILWISPSEYIYKTQRENLKRSNPELSLGHVHFYTYTRLTMLTEEELNKIAQRNPAYIILDEFHRAGAQVWGRSVQRLLTVCPEAKILGLSATNIRYLDNRRDMADELFDGQIASRMSLSEAISDGILPAPVYIASFYQFGEELERLQNKVRYTGNEYLRLILSAKIKKAKRMLAERECGLPDIFQKHITEPAGHYIVFCSGEERLDAAMEECDVWFSGLPGIPESATANHLVLHKYKVLSRYTGSRSEFDAFSQDQTPGAMKLLFCVDMLNEGIHMEKIEGVIMLRSTESANVYYQQLGRALACGRSKKHHPLIFDLVNNFESGAAGSLNEGLIYQLRNEVMGEGADIEFEIYDYILDLAKALEDIRDTFEQSWEYNFAVLQKFVQKQKRFPIHREIVERVHLGDWCSVQRAQYKKGVLQKDRVEQLRAIGFLWDVHEDVWNTNYTTLSDYVSQTGGLPRSCDDRALYIWLHAQKRNQKAGMLSPEHEKQLVDLGVRFDSNYSEERWNQNYIALTHFLGEHGREPKRVETQDGFRVGLWLQEQRRRQSVGELSEKHFQYLSKLGIHIAERRDRVFTENFRLLCAFWQENNRFPMSMEIYDGFGLGAWCLRLREQYRAGELSDEQVMQLKEIQFDFRTAREARNAKRWEENYNELKNYLAHHNSPPKSREQPSLYRWIKKQCEAYAEGRLERDAVVRLEALGVL
ncbi:MAG: Helicase associated domain protein [Lachnospiraceae bacterium]|nr:Helicase associated domain protein [Lachnospiraceae bacterium]